MSNFIHLHTHSHYSLLDGLSKVNDLIARAKEYDMPALAITDHGNMYSGIEFYSKALKAGIKPIFGAEIYVTPGSRHDKESTADKMRYTLTLLAENKEGYLNLIRLVTLGYTEGFFIKPRVDKELLRKYSKGIICLSGSMAGELPRTIKDGDIKQAKKVITEHQEIFGKDNYFLEVMHHPNIAGQAKITEVLISLSKELNIPLVGTQDSHYIDPEDQRAHDTLLAVSNSSDFSQETRFIMGDEDFSFIDTPTAKEYFKDIPEAVENTQKIADRCNVELKLGTWTFPDYKIPEGTTYDSEVRRLAYEGIEKHGLKKTKELTDRIDYELEVIKAKGFSPYFMIVADLLRYARENNIYSTIRGSVAGSMATYMLGITNVNPFEYKLPFERFLNPERPSAPDIDMDFADNRRDEMHEYARQKYGVEKVAQIGTFGTMLAKGAVRDVARALGHPYAVGDKIANLIPLGSQGFAMTIDRAIDMEPDLKKLYKKDPDSKDIIDVAKKLEGCARHISVHAAGVVIGPTELTDFVPLQLDPKGGKLISQYDMHGVEAAGLIKFDFLGIRNLAILGDAVSLIKKYHDIDIDIEKIPINDAKTFEMLARGETMGVFQLSGGGMTKHLKDLKPTTIHDINAMVALYRPGPMEMIPEYIQRKYNPELRTYIDSRLENILEQSYGVITYQDDVMMISIELAGYSWLEADQLRKAMGKKIPELMEEQKKKLHEGFIAHGLTEKKALKLWDLIEPFAAYGFNKAHAASYGRLAYQTAYLKANYPAEYMTAVLTAEAKDVEKISEIIGECKRMDIPVLPPDINESYGNFTVIKDKDSPKNDKIRFGLYSVKNLGHDISDAIQERRKKDGLYKSFTDFLERIQHKNMNKKSLEALIQTGAFDSLEDRSILYGNLEESVEYSRHVTKEKNGDQTSLFGDMSDTSTLPTFKLKDAEPISKEQKLKWEKDLLGVYVSGHPLDRFREKLEKKNISIKKIHEELHEGMTVVVGGIIEEAKIIFTKKGDHMAFVKLADFTSTIETVIFPKLFTEYKEIIEANRCVAIKGKVSKRNGETSLIVDAIKELAE